MGKRDKPAGRLGAAAYKDAWQEDLPPEVRNLIKRRTVDLSSAHELYKKIWNAVRSRRGAVVEEVGKERYKLAAGFFQFFMECLHDLMRFPEFQLVVVTGADLIVQALFQAGMDYGTTAPPPARGRITLWPSDRPISEAWRIFGEPRALLTHPVGIEDPGPGHELRAPISGDYEFPRLLLSIRVNGDRSKLPKFTIDLEGELVCVLMKGLYWSRDPGDLRARRNDAKRIWEAIFRELRLLVGIGHSDEGRPADLRPDAAAFLKYYNGLSWRQVAEELCPKKYTDTGHACTKQCKENFRKAVANYFKRLKQEALHLPPVTG